MSYCVNCGVELDASCRSCPLCSTPVINPNQPIDTDSPGPFPQKRGATEPISHKEAAILISIILGTTALVCLLLNQFVVLTGTRWSYYIVGICAVLWIFLLPYFFTNTIHPYAALLLDGISIAAFLGVISYLHPGNGWFVHIALPVTGLATVLILFFYIFTIRNKSSFIMRAAILIGNIAAVCVAVELLTRSHYNDTIRLTWSAIVLTCCAAIDIILITLSFLEGLRMELRKRMHF